MDFQPLDTELNKHQTFGLLSHINPDGDAIGAMLALGRALAARGKDVTYFSHDGVPDFFKFAVLPGETLIDKAAAGPFMENPFDAAVLVDCATKKRAGEALFPVMDNAGTVINIDHHVTNKTFAAMNFINDAASSTCEILYHFFEQCGWDITPDIAAPLYLGIMYDTGRFIHSNTTPEVFRICSDLVSRGANPAHIANSVFNKRSLAHIRMLGHAFASAQFTADNRVVWAVVPRTVFNELGAGDADTEGIVEELGAYAGCEAHMFFTEGPDGLSRVSSRSTGNIKVNEICAIFSGGGHDFAAGARSKLSLQQLADEFVAEVVKRLPPVKE